MSPGDTADSSRRCGELRRHVRQMSVLHEVTMRIVSALDPDAVLSGVLGCLGELVTYITAGIYLVDLDVAISAEGPPIVTPAGGPLRMRAERTFEEGRTELVDSAVAAEDSAVAQAIRTRETVCGGLPSGMWQLVVPLVVGGDSPGALALSLPAAPCSDDIQILERLAAATAVALQNAHLYQEMQHMATTDPLTGLSNRRHFDELLELEVQRARRMNYAVGLLIMDLDHFKAINDRHGHPAGDEALHRVAELLRSSLRRTDVVGRIGGEEFVVILPGDGRDQVAVVAEKLRKAVEALPPVQGGMAAESTRMTLSIGGTSLAPAALDAQLLVARADRALYEAKRNGRNQVRLA